jgi:hypothetical protein
MINENKFKIKEMQQINKQMIDSKYQKKVIKKEKNEYAESPISIYQQN